jgi:hypothetical protein
MLRIAPHYVEVDGLLRDATERHLGQLGQCNLPILFVVPIQEDVADLSETANVARFLRKTNRVQTLFLKGTHFVNRPLENAYMAQMYSLITNFVKTPQIILSPPPDLSTILSVAGPDADWSYDPQSREIKITPPSVPAPSLASPEQPPSAPFFPQI